MVENGVIPVQLSSLKSAVLDIHCFIEGKAFSKVFCNVKSIGAENSYLYSLTLFIGINRKPLDILSYIIFSN